MLLMDLMKHVALVYLIANSRSSLQVVCCCCGVAICASSFPSSIFPFPVAVASIATDLLVKESSFFLGGVGGECPSIRAS